MLSRVYNLADTLLPSLLFNPSIFSQTFYAKLQQQIAFSTRVFSSKAQETLYRILIEYVIHRYTTLITRGDGSSWSGWEKGNVAAINLFSFGSHGKEEGTNGVFQQPKPNNEKMGK